MNQKIDFRTYQEAMLYAKKCAKETSKATKLVRNGTMWSVLYEGKTAEIKPKYAAHSQFQDVDHYPNYRSVMSDLADICGYDEDSGMSEEDWIDCQLPDR